MAVQNVLLSLLELIVLILTAIIIALQFTSAFYSRIDDDYKEDLEIYISVEMIFVGVASFGVSAIAIIIYLTLTVGVELDLGGRIGLIVIMATFGLGVLLFGTAILSVMQDMMDTRFSRDDED